MEVAYLQAVTGWISFPLFHGLIKTKIGIFIISYQNPKRKKCIYLKVKPLFIVLGTKSRFAKRFLQLEALENALGDRANDPHDVAPHPAGVQYLPLAFCCLIHIPGNVFRLCGE